jgi:hypothetical protein
LRNLEAPGSPEECDVLEQRFHVEAAAVDDVLLEHPANRGILEDPLIAGPHELREEKGRAIGERIDELHEPAHAGAQGTGERAQDGAEERRDRGRAACGSFGPDRGRNAAEDGCRYHAVGHLVRARESIGPAAGKADDREPLDPERLRELADVVRELDDRTVGVRRRRPDPRPLDRDQSNVAVPARVSRRRCDLPACAGGAVEPEDGAPLDRAELGIAELSPVTQAHGALEARRREHHHFLYDGTSG